ncbi:antibiotic biosynthesis monooxygenase family protein [Tundrisphaera sp. TA3]|uniref:antibiotic biosynthesis monooxygenase family protein n=1 Tax=Tundrisphaera sp. TA3 TaxID=3435775 RepID=UPI003EC0A86D
MVTVGLYYDVLPGEGPRFRAKFEEVVQALKTGPGHKSSFLYQRVDDPDSFAILSEWDDPEAFQAFIRSEAFRSVTAWGRETVLRHPPRHKIYPRSEEIGRPG